MSQTRLQRFVEGKVVIHRQPALLQQEEINYSSTAAQGDRNIPNLPYRMLIAGPRENYLEIGVPLYQASIKCNWNMAEPILDKRPELVRFSLTDNGETALHLAASAKADPKDVKEFVRNLVLKMEKEDLLLENEDFNTALHVAAASGYVEPIKIMVEMNDTLLTIPGDRKRLPLYVAALYGNYDVTKYLYKESNLDDDCWNQANRGWLLEKCVENDMFDISLDIVKKYPGLGSQTGNILGILARKPEAYGETKSNITERSIRLIYTLTGSEVGAHEKENQAVTLLKIIWKDIAKKPRKEIDRILRGPPDSIKQEKSASERAVLVIQLQDLISEHLDKMKEQHDSITRTPNPTLALELKSLISEYVVNMHIKSHKIIKKSKPVVGKRDQALELQKLISKHILTLHDDTQGIFKSVSGKEGQAKLLQKVIEIHIKTMRAATTLYESYSSGIPFVAAKVGNTKFLVELIRLYPDLIWKVSEDRLSIFHIAVKYRHEGIYNLLYGIGAMKDLITNLKDENENNLLHLVGKCAKLKQLQDVSGVAFQMQRELLWFHEVKNMIPHLNREQKNKDGLTPHELFTMEHKELLKESEKWMKGTASQCMVVAALIATIVFAVAFTVPGGYDQNTGIPTFNAKATFIVFVVADAISLIASSASILIFLAMLTSRYAQSDFLVSLPTMLILGLLTLFLAVTNMTLAFGISFFVLYNRGLLWIPLIISMFCVFPILIYITLHYGLFVDVIRSIYRSRHLFKTEKNTFYYENPTV